MKNIVILTLELEIKKIKESNRPIIIFGAGTKGKLYFDMFKKIEKYNTDNKELYSLKIEAFCDNYSKNDNIEGIPILRLEEIKSRFKNPLFIIACFGSKDFFEVNKQLSDEGLEAYTNILLYNAIDTFINYNRTFPNFRICNNITGSYKEWYDSYKKEDIKLKLKQVYDLFEDETSKKVFKARLNMFKNHDYYQYSKDVIISKENNPYFESDIFDIGDNEIFVDCGAFIGDTLEAFIKTTKGKYNKIFSFEPNRSSFEQLKDNFENSPYHDIELFNMGIGKEKGKIKFREAKKPGGSLVIEDGEVEINIECLDNLFLDIPVTYIKMDIEGSELDALLGGQQVIKKFKPKLAICVYHKVYDIYKIPLFLHELVKDYSFKLRQHGEYIEDTVLYAYVK